MDSSADGTAFNASFRAACRPNPSRQSTRHSTLLLNFRQCVNWFGSGATKAQMKLRTETPSVENTGQENGKPKTCSGVWKNVVSGAYLSCSLSTTDTTDGHFRVYRVAQKWHSFWYALTSSSINRFSKLFHCQNQEKICNNTVTKDSTTSQVCRYTTL